MMLRRSIPADKWAKSFRLCKLFMAAAGLFLLAALISSASAHHLGAAHAGPAKGLAIPSLSHGQMVVIAANRSAILKLASEQTPTDPTLRRLQGYINLQFFACMWGIIPGSVDDENSPFNECSHAYLAGTRSLLMHLLTMQSDRAPVRALADKIEVEMLQNDASLVMCRYSDEPFDTAEIIGPHWSEIPFHPMSFISLVGFPLATAGCIWLVARQKRLFA
jgi:hypothetical protein